jgi:XTP/dITP diphosphohydrolase
MKIVLASNNAGKICEFQALLKNFAVTIIPQAELNMPEIEETGVSFVENAILKARHAAKLSGLPALADDSGLAVKALNGAPGIYSARYAGEPSKSENNIKKLLAALEQVPDEKRQASFHCILAFMSCALDPTPLIVNGEWRGMITREPRGNNGFGYDPVFYVPDLQQTSAELSSTLKNTLSHRSIALQLLLKALPSKL